MNLLAIVNVPKQNGSPVLQFPNGTTTTKEGNVWKVSWNGRQAFFYVLRNNTSRWIALVAAPKRALLWMENKLGADIYRVTPALVKNQRVALENLGLTFDGAGRMLAPHAICGQSPWVSPG